MTRKEYMVKGYLRAALFTATGANGEPLDNWASTRDFTDEARRKAEQRVEAFLAKEGVEAALDGAEAEDGGMGDWQAGIDLWMTESGQGAGFWDGDWAEPFASVLTDAATSLPGEGYVDLSNGQLELGYC